VTLILEGRGGERSEVRSEDFSHINYCHVIFFKIYKLHYRCINKSTRIFIERYIYIKYSFGYLQINSYS